MPRLGKSSHHVEPQVTQPHVLRDSDPSPHYPGFYCPPWFLCRVLGCACIFCSNAGQTEKFKEALDEATATGVPWAMSMTRRRQDVLDKKEVKAAAAHVGVVVFACFSPVFIVLVEGLVGVGGGGGNVLVVSCRCRFFFFFARVRRPVGDSESELEMVSYHSAAGCDYFPVQSRSPGKPEGLEREQETKGGKLAFCSLRAVDCVMRTRRAGQTRPSASRFALHDFSCSFLIVCRPSCVPPPPPPFSSLVCQRAGKAYAANRYSVAYSLYSEAICVDLHDYHTNALLFANRAAALMNMGRNKDALKDCEEASKNLSSVVAGRDLRVVVYGVGGVGGGIVV